MTLRLEFCSHSAAKYSCLKWHYSRVMPAGKLVQIGVWEDERFIGVVLFGRGATMQIGDPYGLNQIEVCELVRIALSAHKAPVTKIVSIALRMLRATNPGLRLVVSYAAEEEGHLGGIYQAGNWIYEGARESYLITVHGKPTHARSIGAKYGTSSMAFIREHVDPHATKDSTLIRHKYLMPLDPEMRAMVEQRKKPYPKRVKQAMTGPPEQRRGSTDRHAPNKTKVA